MAQKIENPGTYIGTIIESGIATTKNSFPQWVARLKATKRYIDVPADITYFQGQGLLADGQPDFVDYTPYDEEILAYVVLYDKNEKQTLSNEQLSKATGWITPDFDGLSQLVGKDIQFRVEFRTYTSPEGKTTEGNQVTWIDPVGTNPARILKTLDADAIKALTAKYGGVKKPVAVAKPASSAATPPKPTPAPASAPAAPKAGRPKKGPPAVVSPPATIQIVASSISSTETNLDGAWEAVNNAKGDVADSDMEQAWVRAMAEVGGTRKQEELSPAEYAKVRDLTIGELHGLHSLADQILGRSPSRSVRMGCEAPLG